VHILIREGLNYCGRRRQSSAAPGCCNVANPLLRMHHRERHVVDDAALVFER
jgi:hypothetical protein